MRIKKRTRRKIFIIISILIIYMIGRVDILPKKNKIYKNEGYYKFVVNYIMLNEHNENIKSSKTDVKEPYYKNRDNYKTYRLKYNVNDEYFIYTNDGIESYAVDDILSIHDLIEY